MATVRRLYDWGASQTARRGGALTKPRLLPSHGQPFHQALGKSLPTRITAHLPSCQLFAPLHCLGVLVMKSIPELDINLSWVVPVEATEGLAVIEFHAAICDVECIQRSRESFAEVLPD